MKDELLADTIAEKIKDKIKDGSFSPNDRLTVRHLCEEYNVSETPVKQALNQLTGMGLVVAVPKCGIRVKSFNFSEMQNIWNARLMIELYASESAINAVKEKPSFRTRMEKMLENTNSEYQNCCNEFTRSNFNKLAKNDYAMHLEMVKSCNNPVIITMYENLRTHENMFVGFDVHTPASIKITIAQHTAIVNALLQEDLPLLQSAISEHIHTTIALYKNHRK